MRTVELTDEDWDALSEDGFDFEGLSVQTLDWKECSDAALEAFDALLGRRGLQVVNFESGGDCFVFAIEEKRK